ncbi:kelch domain-containing protein 7A [Melanerpes formicivorus]|uniref:kelch domain-containing protein 7A n=1 Tax=Melanerpes formicivorus TaxID=211600 RepID=UPI00358E0607
MAKCPSRFYRSRSLAGGRSPPAEVGEERESASRHGHGDGEVALRRRRGLGEEVRRAGGHGEVSEEQGSGCVTACGDRRLLRGEEEMEKEGEEMVHELGLRDGRAGMAGRESGLRSEQGSNLGSELGSQLGREMGSELGSQTGKDLEYGLGSELGSKPGTELASKREHKLGREVGSKLGSQLGREMGSELGCQLEREMRSELGSQAGKHLEYGLGSELGSKPGTELASKRGHKLGKEVGSKLGSQPGMDLESELGSKPGSELASKTGHKVGREMGSKLRSQLGREMGSELGSQPGMDLEYGLGNELGSKSGNEEESKLRSKQGSKPGRELASKRGLKLGSELESKVASKPGRKSGSEPAIELGSKEGSDLGRELGSKLGSELGSELRKEPGINLKSYLRSEPGSRLGKESGSKLGSELASKPGSDLGNEPGSKVGSQPGREPSSHDSRGTARSPSISRQEASRSPSSKPPPATADAQMDGGGRTQSTEQDVAIRGMSQEAEGCRELIQTLSITSGLGLTMTTSNAGSDTSYSFSSVAKIQVEENYITERRVKAGAGQTVPGLRGKVYDYYVQSISQSVVKKRSSLYTPPGTSQRCSLELFNEELRSRSASQESGPAPATQESDPAPATQESHPAPAPQESDPAPAPQESDPAPATQESDPAPAPQESHPAPAPQESHPAPAPQESDPAPPLEDFTISSIAPPPTGSLEIPSQPPSPGRKVSILQIADSPHLQLPMEGFGVTAEATTPPASPQAGLGHDADFFQTWPAARLDLGNCYEVLCAAKARKLGELQEAAYQVMSDNYLQVLRTPAIYGRLNAAERELILRRRMKGKRCVAVADVSPQEPGGPRAGRLCYYDEAGDSWHHLCHLPPEAVSRGCAVCSMFNYLFVAAGCEGAGRARRPSKRVFCYDPLANLWREICPLNQARPRCKLVALDGHLYAIGGECLCTVERYDPRRDRWSFAAPLPRDTFAVAHAAAACQGEIYVTGGTLRSLLLRYAARTDSWSLGLAGGGKQRTVEMVSTDGFLYRFDLHPSAGIGVYRCGAKAKLWYQCAAYPLPDLPGFQCAVLGSLVHCVGRHFHLRFLADHVSPRFGAKELQPFPEPRGSLFPAVLVLPEGGRAQTEV